MTEPARSGWRRLWRPAHPLFWLMLMFNVLSSLGAWALRILPLSDLGNALLGLVVMARLWRLP
jgi:4-hydroxybenzoate polyprenyltransferase